MRSPRRLIIATVLVGLVAAVWMVAKDHLPSWSELARHRTALTEWIAAHPRLAPCLYVASYTASVALSLPQGALLTVAGGLLFGTLIGGALAVIGATLGAVTLFLIARSAAAGPMAARGGATVAGLRKELRQNGFAYLLALRLIPLVPFWLVNLAAALSGIGLRQFAIATFIGIMPATFVIASVGAGIGDVVARGEQPDLNILLSWPVLGPLLALAVLSLTPVVWRKLHA